MSRAQRKLPVSVPRFMINGSGRLTYEPEFEMFKSEDGEILRCDVLTNGHWMLWSDSLFRPKGKFAPILFAAIQKAVKTRKAVRVLLPAPL